MLLHACSVKAMTEKTHVYSERECLEKNWDIVIGSVTGWLKQVK